MCPARVLCLFCRTAGADIFSEGFVQHAIGSTCVARTPMGIDKANGWTVYSCETNSVEEGRVGDAASWVFEEDGKCSAEGIETVQFTEEKNSNSKEKSK